MGYKYTFNHNYGVRYEQGFLVITAGADKIFAIPDVTEECAEELLRALKKSFLDPAKLSAESKSTIEQLVTAGVLLIKHPKNRSSKFNVYVRYIGDRVPGMDQLLRKTFAEKKIEVSSKSPDLVIFVRTNCQLKNLLDQSYQALTSPHLLIDLAYHHTISIGPLVYPGETSCFGCLIGRINNYWGDPTPPKEPLMVKNVELAACLTAMEVEKISYGNQSLINKTVTYDFEDYQIKTNSIYKLPWCPICQTRNPIANIGFVELPWIKE